MKNPVIKNIKPPFVDKSEYFGFNMTDAFLNKDIARLRALINEAINYIPSDEIDYHYVTIYYDLGTAFDNLNILLHELFEDKEISEEELEVVNNNKKQALRFYRSALYCFNSGKLDSYKAHILIRELEYKLLTNYANALVHVSRFVKAFKIYSLVIQRNQSFDITKGSFGTALLDFSNFIEPSNNRDLIALYSNNYLEKAIDSNHHEILESFKDNYLKAQATIPSDLKESRDEIYARAIIDDIKMHESYRKWIKANCLFLSFLNDIPEIPIEFLIDDINLPSLSVDTEESSVPIVFHMFNQIKTTYLYSRYLLYKSTLLKEGDVFFEDAQLIDTEDNCVFNIASEELKQSLNLSYSVFDKIATLINYHWGIGIDEKDVNKNNIWWKEFRGKKTYKYNRVLDKEKNPPLNGLYWLIQDFNVSYVEGLAPENKVIKLLRDNNEHKYLFVYNGVLTHEDNIAYHIDNSDLIQLCFNTLSLAREAIVYLYCAMYIEECYRHEDFNYTSHIDNYIELSIFDGKE